MKTPVKIGFFGCGNVGSGVYRLISGFAADIEHRTGCTFEVKKILVRNPDKNRGLDLPRSIYTTDVNEILNDPEISVVLEFLGGIEPAHIYVCEALKRGKNVVTANKVALALYWPEMQRIAAENGGGLFYEAAVCGAIPILHMLEDSLQANRIDSIYGIVNGTTNYILSSMSQNGTEYKDALAQAQKLGLAEPDPSNDVEGLDAAYKLCILASLAFHGRVPFENVFVEGITGVQAEDIRFGQEMGYTLKLLAIARREELSVETRVHPTFISSSHPMANVSDAFNAVFLHGHACKELMFMGRGAGDMPTASAVVSDLLRAVTDRRHTYPTFDNSESPKTAFENNANWETAFYLRLYAKDEPGVLGKIAQTLAAHSVSIAAMQQKAVSESGLATLIFVTHPAREKDMRSAIAELPEEIARVQSLIRMIE